MLFRNLLLPGVLMPMAGAALVAGLWQWGRSSGRLRGNGGGAAVAAAFLASYVGLTGWPRWPPVEATQRLFFIIVLAAIVSLVAAALGRAVAAPWRWTFGALLVGLLTAPLRQHTWEGAQALLWPAVLFALFVAVDHGVMRSTLRGSEGRSPLSRSVVLLTLLGGTSLALGLSGSARLAQLLGAATCGVFVVELVGLRRGRRAWDGSDAPVLALALGGLVLCGHYYASLTLWPTLLLTASFALLALAPGRGGSDDARAAKLTVVLLPLLPWIVALTLVLVAFFSEQDDPYGDYYGSVDALSIDGIAFDAGHGDAPTTDGVRPA